jgi:predicted small metal-binding protein
LHFKAGSVLIRIAKTHWKGANMKTLNCRDAGLDCEETVSASSEEEVLRQAAEHARTAHNVDITPEMAERIRPLIRDDKE